MAKLTHRRTGSELSDGFVMLFAEDDRNAHYGPHCWTLRADELPNACDDETLIGFAAEYLGVDRDEAADMVNPDDIVSTAGLWDDPQFVSELHHISSLQNIVGWRTYNGAVVLDRDAVEMDYSYRPAE